MNLPDKLTLVCTSTEATTTSKNNSNKFHKWEKLPNGNYTHTYGRVGDPGVSHEVAPAKMQAKMKDALRNGYKEVNIAGSEPVTSSAPKGSATAKTAVEEIAKGDPVITKLVEFLSAQNVHNISQSTTLKYDAVSGLFSTPLGIVSQDSIDEARTLLATAQEQVVRAEKQGWGFVDNKVATDYLMLIPTDIGRDRPTFQRIFPDLDAVQKQNDILESLEGSLTMAAKQVVSKKAKAAPAPRVWDITVKKIDDKTEIERIRTKFRKTHEYGQPRFDVRNVYDVSINHMKKAFDSVGKKIGGIEEMWHGTSVGNVLSIFAKGLIIPSQYSNGRNFGNGVYASRQSHKSLQYAGTFRSATRSSCYMFLVEVAMGKNFIPKSRVQNPPAGYDSMDVIPGSAGGWPHHEAIVYKTAQTNVVRLIEFAA